MSATSVHYLHMMLHRALDNALRLDLVLRNVCDLVDPPRMQRHLTLALTPSQARSLLDAAKGNPLEALFVVVLNTGMRLGELLALRWLFVDLDVCRSRWRIIAGARYTSARTEWVRLCRTKDRA